MTTPDQCTRVSPGFISVDRGTVANVGETFQAVKMAASKKGRAKSGRARRQKILSVAGVRAAALRLRATGKAVTIRSLRAECGSGGNTTLLALWNSVRAADPILGLRVFIADVLEYIDRCCVEDRNALERFCARPRRPNIQGELDFDAQEPSASPDRTKCRKNLDEDDVRKAALRIRARGEKPSIDLIIRERGGGSPNRVVELWRAVRAADPSLDLKFSLREILDYVSLCSDRERMDISSYCLGRRLAPLEKGVRIRSNSRAAHTYTRVPGYN